MNLFEIVETTMVRVSYDGIADLSGELVEGGLFQIRFDNGAIMGVIHQMFDADMLVYPIGSGAVTAEDVREANKADES